MLQSKSEGVVRSRVVVQVLMLANLATAISQLSACGAKVEQGSSQPVKIKTFEEVIGDAHCLACHLPNNKVGAPSWKAVARRYKRVDAAAVEAHLTSKIAQGGSGAWGRVDMPPYPELTESELRVAARGVLAEGER